MLTLFLVGTVVTLLGVAFFIGRYPDKAKALRDSIKASFTR